MAKKKKTVNVTNISKRLINAISNITKTGAYYDRKCSYILTIDEF
jgi:hypothetical protein